MANSSSGLSPLLWIGWRNLTRGDVNRRTTLSNLACVVFVSANCLFVLGLGLAYRKHLKDEIADHPHRMCLFVRPEQAGSRLSAENVQAISEAARSAGGAAGIRGSFPFRAETRDCYFLDAGHQSLSIPIRGRTLSAEDPFLNGMSFVSKPAGPRGSTAGIYLTSSLLARLSAFESQSGSSSSLEHLAVRDADGRSRQIAVLGVVKDELPFGHAFVMTDALCDALDRKKPRHAKVTSGAIGENWPRPKNLLSVLDEVPEDLLDVLDRFAVTLEGTESHGDSFAWVLSYKEKDPPTRETWQEVLQNVARNLPECFDQPSDRFWTELAPGKGLEADSPERRFDGVAVYLHDPQAAKPVYRRIVDDGYVADPAAAEQADALGRSMSGAFWLLLGLFVAMAFYGVLNLFTTGFLRSQLMTAEIGMLKAIGMTPGQLLLLAVFEALAIGLAGSLLGAPLGILIAALVFQFVPGRESTGSHHLVDSLPPGWMVGAVVLLVVLGAMAAAAMATRRSRARSPCETLRPN